MRSPMMKKLFVLALVSSTFALGCELIVDFDRTKIVGEEVAETGTPDATTSDSGGTDSASDAKSDSASDAGNDATDAADDVQDASDGG